MSSISQSTGTQSQPTTELPLSNDQNDQLDRQALREGETRVQGIKNIARLAGLKSNKRNMETEDAAFAREMKAGQQFMTSDATAAGSGADDGAADTQSTDPNSEDAMGDILAGGSVTIMYGVQPTSTTAPANPAAVTPPATPPVSPAVAPPVALPGSVAVATQPTQPVVPPVNVPPVTLPVAAKSLGTLGKTLAGLALAGTGLAAGSGLALALRPNPSTQTTTITEAPQVPTGGAAVDYDTDTELVPHN